MKVIKIKRLTGWKNYRTGWFMRVILPGVLAPLCSLCFITSLCAGIEQYYGRFYCDGSSQKAEFALTYDDGPGYITGDLLRLLDKYQARATFFMTGLSVKKYPDRAAKVARAGHLVGSHTWSHESYVKVSVLPDRGKILEKELDKAADVILKAVGKKPVFLRMPNGYNKDWVRKTAAEKGYIIVNWSYGSDWTGISEDKMTAGYLKNLGRGKILIMHDGGGRAREKTLRITEKILLQARKKGLKAVALDELLDIRTAGADSGRGKGGAENIVK